MENMRRQIIESWGDKELSEEIAKTLLIFKNLRIGEELNL